MSFALPLGNGLIMRKVLERKKPMAIKSNAKIQLHAKLVSQFILHEAESVKCVFIFNSITTISTNFMHFESLWLSVGDVVTLRQS